MSAAKDTTYTLLSVAEINGTPKTHNVRVHDSQLLFFTASSTITFVVLVLNIGLLIWSATKFGIHNGTTVVYTGSLSEVERLSLWSHLGINIISTLVLAASNSCMQRLNAPTRGDVDKAHNNGQRLDFGVLSIRNFGFMTTGKLWLWFVLALSTIPLHLL